MPGMSPQAWQRGDQPVHPQIGVSAQRDQHQPYAETSTVYTPRSPRQSDPRPLHPTPVLMEGQGLHPCPTAHWDCRWDDPITTPHLPSASWALAVKPQLRGTDTSPTPASGLGLPHGTGISALHRLASPTTPPSPTTATTRAMYTHTSHVGGQVTPSPVPSHQALSLPPLNSSYIRRGRFPCRAD